MEDSKAPVPSGNLGRVIEVKSPLQLDHFFTSQPNDHLSVVFYYASWYEPSVQFIQPFAALSIEYPSVSFMLTDLDVMKSKGRFDGASPTILLQKGKETIKEFSGISGWNNTMELAKILRYEIQSTGAKPITEEELQELQKKEQGKQNKTSLPEMGEESQSRSAMGLDVNFQRKSYQHFPLKNFVLYETGKVEQIRNKILEFNDKAEELRLSENQKEELERITKVAEGHSLEKLSDLNVVEHLLKWPEALLFPVFDLLRLLLLQSEVAKVFAKSEKEFIFTNILSNLSPDNNPPDPTVLMALRTFSNHYKSILLQDRMLKMFKSFLDRTIRFVLSPNKNVRLSLATVLLNHSVLLLDSNRKEELEPCYGGIRKSLEREEDEEILSRLLVALATLASGTAVIHEATRQQLKRENFDMSRFEELESLKSIVGELKDLLSE